MILFFNDIFRTKFRTWKQNWNSSFKISKRKVLEHTSNSIDIAILTSIILDTYTDLDYHFMLSFLF